MGRIFRIQDKIRICLLFVCGIVIAFVCVSLNAGAADRKEENIPYNPYFFTEDHVALTARAAYFTNPAAEDNIHLTMYKVHGYEHGAVYKLEIEHVGYLEDARWNIYFYVMKDKIYRLYSWVYQDDQILSFYDDDALLVNVLNTDEKLIENGTVVCQREELSVDEEDGEGRYRYSIFKKDDQITYYRSDVQPNGERGFYEWFIWKEGRGLIEYGSGYKAEADFLYLYDIAIDTEKAFPMHGNKDKRRIR